jgi:hypothetical protein
MEQIYYTQCPVGYGVGASGGLQIKRHDAGYPLCADLRHLALRAFLGTSRTLAPETLRYRRDGDVAEIAKLTPREKEYETERGLWGRPGGYFAHGLRLSSKELGAVANWPAGLMSWPHWVTKDAEPSHGRTPESLPEPWPAPFLLPAFAEVARFAADKKPELLAGLLTALAAAAKEGRCLFLIDEAARLWEWVALLTFAFPEAMRPDLTFSTFHDRPEELMGFRLQGIAPQTRPNRAVLAGMGAVVDVGQGVFSPPLSAAEWAVGLARALIRNDSNSREAWSRRNRLAAALTQNPVRDRQLLWADEWLNACFAYERATFQRDVPASAAAWVELGDLARWSAQFGLATEWAAARPTAWWLSASAADLPEARTALLAQIALPEAWSDRGAGPGEWGRALAAWFAHADTDERVAAISDLLASAPEDLRSAAFAKALRSWPEDVASGVLLGLASHPLLRPAMRLPLLARGAVAALRDRENPEPVVDLLRQAFDVPDALRDLLNAIADEVEEDPHAIELLSKSLSGLIATAKPDVAFRARNWALARGGEPAAQWIGPELRLRLADPTYPDRLAALWKQTPERLRPALVWALLIVAKDPNLGRGVFPWIIENLLLGFTEGDRPRDPTWANDYVRRVGSGYELVRRIYMKETRHPELKRWIRDAYKDGLIEERQLAQLARCHAFYQTLESGEAEGLRAESLPAVPDADRGPLLEEMIRRLGLASFEGLEFCLDSCRLAWPGAFQPHAPGLSGIGKAIAYALRELQSEPAAWFERLVTILDRVKASMSPEAGFEPSGMAAEVVAAANRSAGAPDPWRLRAFLLQHPSAWKTLSVDASRDLVGGGSEATLKAFRTWDQELTRGPRLAELLLNSCDPAALVAVVCGARDEAGDICWAAEFRTMPPLRWWNAPAGASGDIRDRFARQAQLAPLPEDSLTALKRWMEPVPHASSGTAFGATDDWELLPEHPGDGDTARARAPAQAEPLSRQGAARWGCLYALSIASRRGLDCMARWSEVCRWAAARLPVGLLSVPERQLFVAWLILRSDFWDVLPLDRNEPAAAKISLWLYEQGLSTAPEIDTIKQWDRQLGEHVDSSELYQAQAFRPKFVDAIWWGLRQELARNAEGGRKSPPHRSLGA